MSGQLSISRAWDEAKARIAADGRLFVAVALALVALPQAIVVTLGPPVGLSGVEPSGAAELAGVVAGLIGIAGQIALVRLALGPSSVGEAIVHGFRRLGFTLIALLLFAFAAMLLCIPVLMLMGTEQLAAISAGNPPEPSALGYFLLLMIAILLIAVRFQLIIPIASAEPIGPIAILKRCWELTKGHYWKFLGFLLAVLIVAIVLLGASGLLAGVLTRILFGEAEPMSVAALIVGLLTGVVQAVFTVGVSVTLARIYAQLVGSDDALEASVPSSGI